MCPRHSLLQYNATAQDDLSRVAAALEQSVTVAFEVGPGLVLSPIHAAQVPPAGAMFFTSLLGRWDSRFEDL